MHHTCNCCGYIYSSTLGDPDGFPPIKCPRCTGFTHWVRETDRIIQIGLTSHPSNNTIKDILDGLYTKEELMDFIIRRVNSIISIIYNTHYAEALSRGDEPSAWYTETSEKILIRLVRNLIEGEK